MGKRVQLFECDARFECYDGDALAHDDLPVLYRRLPRDHAIVSTSLDVVSEQDKSSPASVNDR